MNEPNDTTALSRFSPATRAWFTRTFTAPTRVQAGAWAAISGGEHALVVAPTGSGKTLAAFLWAIDSLAAAPPPVDAQHRCRVLYVSPLKALGIDVERNLRAPLAGISDTAAASGQPRPAITVAVRSGDTPADERRRFARTPSDILITTPESLYLLLTSQAREALRGVTTVILDEVHAVAGTKRGAHLALSLERLDALLPQPAQRIGLSATVRPLPDVARFLAGQRPVTIVDPPADKTWDLTVQVPVADLAALDTTPPPPGTASPDAEGVRRASIWPHVEERIVDLIEQHRSTLVFVNARRLAETLTTRINEIAALRATGRDPRAHTPGMAPAPHSTGYGSTSWAADAPAVVARAHHGSMAAEQRAITEEALKAGDLPAVVATSSLELGIDMGAIDLVIQVEAPPSVASGLQRVGRAGHQVGATSTGVFFPKFRGDLIASAVTVERMRAGAIEALAIPANPLDVLAQHIVAMVALDDWTVDDLEAVVRRSAPFATLTRGVLESVLDMLAGRYPSEEFAELRPRLVWDRTTGTLTGRRGAQRIAVTSGGTIPDRGLYGVFVLGDGPGRRVGELDEEMVYETRVGDVITLGTSAWRVEDITHDQVLVSPAPGQASRLPFWKGDSVGRAAELGGAIGGFVRELTGMAPDAARARLAASGLDAWASDNLLGYLADQAEATGVVPDDTRIVVESFADEVGDWRIVIHSPHGGRVHAPWALAIAARLRQRHGVDVAALHADDGIVLRLPLVGDPDADPATAALPADVLEAILPDPEEVRALVTDEVGASALFAGRFRECAGRALLLPNRRPGRRQALWQQRARSAQLLGVARQYPRFPIVLEAVRECLQDVFDLPALIALLDGVRAGTIAVHQVTTAGPSPFASSLMHGYVARFLYEEDTPLAERRAAALSLDPDLLADLLGSGEGLGLRDLLDADVLTRTESELQHLTPSRQARDADDVHDLLRTLGPLTSRDVAARCSDPATAREWLDALHASGRIITDGGTPARWGAVEDAARLRDALGWRLPASLPDTFAAPVSDPLGDLLVRYARTHGPFTSADAATHLGLGAAIAESGYRRLADEGRVVGGAFGPPGWQRSDGTTGGGGEPEWLDPGVLRILRRRSVAALRAEVEPVDAAALARFLPAWQGVGSGRGPDGVLRAVEQLAGVPLPASALESLILPARVSDYTPAWLDELCASGEVMWRGHGNLSGADGWITLWPSDLAALAEPTAPADGDAEVALIEALAHGGASFFGALASAVGDPGGMGTAATLWSLVWKGLVTNDTLAPVRARLASGGTAHRVRSAPPRGRTGRPRLPRAPRPTLPAALAGRWSLTSDAPAPPWTAEERAVATAEVLLDRYGVVTRAAVQAEGVPGGFSGVYRVLSAAEDAGRLRRGYFIEGLGAAQFATAAAVDRLRSGPAAGAPRTLVLAASDPAHPYGAALPWPASGAHRPSRRAGALVVLRDGIPVVWLERGGRTALTWGSDGDCLAEAAGTLAALVHAGRLDGLTITTMDAAPALEGEHPFAVALLAAGFRPTPQGLRLRH